MQKNIPKIIWMYWEQGWEQAPELVKKCKKSWEKHNPKWEVRALDEDTILEFFDIKNWMPNYRKKQLIAMTIILLKTFIKRLLRRTNPTVKLIKNHSIIIQHRSDIIRVALLKQYGGIWVDATLFCRKPLDEWLSPHIQQDFFALSNPGKNLRLAGGSLAMASSYFLVSTKNHYMIKKLYSAVYRYWQKHLVAGQYYLIFKLFNECYHNDDKFAQIWDKIIKLDAHIPNAGEFDKNGGIEFFALQTKEQLNDLSDTYKKMLNTSKAPFFKLSRNEQYAPSQSSCINYLLKQT